MFEPQHFIDLQDNSDFGSKSWLSGDSNNSSPTQHRTQSSLTHSSNSNLDRVLYKDLVEMIPLVQSLIVISSLCILNFTLSFFLKSKNKNWLKSLSLKKINLLLFVNLYFDQERKANSSFTRRGSIIYTKTPSRESLSRKVRLYKYLPFFSI